MRLTNFSYFFGRLGDARSFFFRSLRLGLEGVWGSFSFFCFGVAAAGFPFLTGTCAKRRGVSVLPFKRRINQSCCHIRGPKPTSSNLVGNYLW